ncbi:MAG: pilus assembly protein PilM [Verrucomicrobia bacterium]|nr:pilus assembly protein PilM [Verrucomicrobiota bacterium]MDA1087430.1 pilus assembly protein PilM [Verrucomicrobiota bacterium]
MAQGGKSVIIIEVGGRWLKMARVDFSRRGAKISRLHTARHDGDLAVVPEMISQASVKLKLSRETVISYLPRQVVSVRLLDLPSSDPQEVADMVDLQIGKQTPYSRDEIISGYRVIGSDGTGYTRVLLGIVQRALVRQRFGLLEAAGLNVDRMSISSEGLVSWHATNGVEPPAAPGEADVVIDLDSGHADFMVIEDGQLRFTRSILVGADELTQEAEEWRPRFIQEVGRSLDIYRGEHRASTLGRIFLTGAGVQIKDLPALISEEFGLPTEALLSTRNIEIADDLIVPEGVSLTPLIGVALKVESLAFDLVPDAVRVRRSLEVTARHLTALGVLVMAVLFGASVYLSSRYYFKDAVLTELVKRRDEIAPSAEDVLKRRDVIKWYHQRRDSRVAPSKVLADLHTRLPDDVWLTRVDFKGRQEIVYNGEARSRAAKQRFFLRLGDSPLYREVSNPRTDVRGDRVIFEMVCMLETGEGAR